MKTHFENVYGLAIAEKRIRCSLERISPAGVQMRAPGAKRIPRRPYVSEGPMGVW